MSLLKATATAIGGQVVTWLTANTIYPRTDYAQLPGYPPVEEVGEPTFSTPNFSDPRGWTVTKAGNSVDIYPTDITQDTTDGIWSGTFDTSKKLEVYLTGNNLSFEWKYITATQITPRGLSNV